MDPFHNPPYIITTNEESSIPPKCDHCGQPTCVSPSHQSSFPNNHDPLVDIKHDINVKYNDGSEMPKVAIHQRFMSLIVDISTFWSEERILWSRLHPFVPSSPMVPHAWAFCFPTSRFGSLPYDYSCPPSWFCYISNHWANFFILT